MHLAHRGRDRGLRWGYLPPPGPGILADTAICSPFASNATYKIAMHVSDTDVAYTIYERVADEGGITWEPVVSGGCLATAGHTCLAHPKLDERFGDAFIVSGKSAPRAPASWTWSVSEVDLESC